MHIFKTPGNKLVEEHRGQRERKAGQHRAALISQRRGTSEKSAGKAFQVAGTSREVRRQTVAEGIIALELLFHLNNAT